MALSPEERAAWVGLHLTPGIGPGRFARLVQHFGSARAAWQAPIRELQAAGLPENVVEALTQTRKRVHPEKLLEQWAKQGIRVVLQEDPEYPPRLRHIPQAPPVLYVKGQWLPEDDWAVAVVGTRKATAYGRRVAEDVAQFLARHRVTVVSGLARGIDGVAHRAALDAGGRTLAVLAHGPDRIYPPEHRRLARRIVERGALISDYPPGTRPEAPHFPARNRLISGLSLAVVVVEAGERSGALITAAFAADQGREVFAVPGPIYAAQSQGTLRLIQQGAHLLRTPEDLAQALNLSLLPQQQEARRRLPQEPLERLLWEHLQEPTHIDDLCERTGLSSPQVSALLTLMELKGLVRQVASMTYVAVG